LKFNGFEGWKELLTNQENWKRSIRRNIRR